MIKKNKQTTITFTFTLCSLPPFLPSDPAPPSCPAPPRPALLPQRGPSPVLMWCLHSESDMIPPGSDITHNCSPGRASLILLTLTMIPLVVGGRVVGGEEVTKCRILRLILGQRDQRVILWRPPSLSVSTLVHAGQSFAELFAYLFRWDSIVL